MGWPEPRDMCREPSRHTLSTEIRSDEQREGPRNFQQARWDEPIIFELSTPGCAA